MAARTPGRQSRLEKSIKFPGGVRAVRGLHVDQCGSQFSERWARWGQTPSCA